MIGLTEKKSYTKIPEEVPQINSQRSSSCRNIFIILGLALGLLYYIYTLHSSEPLPGPIYTDGYNISMKICVPGKFGDMYSQLPLQTWTPPGKDFNLPMYSTHNLNEIGNKKIHAAIIIQHGNLRNANDYFCGAVNSLLESNLSPELMASTLIIAPFFPILNDVCWDKITNIPRIITKNEVKNVSGSG